MSVTPINQNKLVDAKGLLEALFDERTRPTVTWVRLMQRSKTIPYYKIGHLVRFDVDEVREALKERNQVRSRPARKAA